MSEKEDQAPTGFKVVDKRRFNESGELRDPSKSTDEAREEQAPKVKTEQKLEQVEQVADSSAETESEGSLDFSSFIVSMATQALMLLGEVPNPETGEHMLNLDAAQQTIDIIVMLEKKTKSNQTKEEEKLFSDILSSLRLAYVSKTGSSVKK